MGGKTQVVCLDGPEDDERGVARLNLVRGICLGQNLAYVMYTSGSTGSPRGAWYHHRVVRFVQEHRWRGLDSEDRVAQFASVSFDALTFGIWAALL